MITKVSLGDEEMGNFYVLLQDNEVIGCCGLVTHDMVTSRNFYPWVTSLYIDEAYRGRNYGQLLLNHVGHQAQLMGYQKLYLTTGIIAETGGRNLISILVVKKHTFIIKCFKNKNNYIFFTKTGNRLLVSCFLLTFSKRKETTIKR